MATTPNYGWVMPDPTDFVTDLPADFEIFGDAVDTTLEAIETKLDVITTEGDLIVGDASGDPVRVAIGAAGQVLASDGDTIEWADPASSGVNWTTRVYAGEFLSTNYTRAKYQNGRWVVLGRETGTNNAFVLHSTDAITWTKVNIGTTSQANDIIYSNVASLWITVHNSGGLFTSPDLVTWTSRTSQHGSATINGIVENNSIIVITGGGNATDGQASSSTNGTTWTSRQTGTPIFSRAVWNQTIGRFAFVTTNIGTNLGAFTSTNGTSWTGFTLSVAQSQIASIGDYFVTSPSASTSASRISSDGTTWTNVASNTSNIDHRAAEATNLTTTKALIPAGTNKVDLLVFDLTSFFNNAVSISRFAPSPYSQNYLIAANGAQLLAVNDIGQILTSF
jgi:hypothetical protein